MSLQPLEWRKLPVRTLPAILPNITASYCLNVIYDMLTGSLYHDGSTRTLGSGSAWQMPTKFVTGSNTEAVYVFPGFQTVVSQSIIFAGISPGVSSSNSATSVTGGTWTASFLYIGSVKNASGSFTQFTSRHPFGSGSYLIGYAPFMNVTHMTGSSKIAIYESKEALCVYLSHPYTRYGYFGMAGAIIDPEQSASLNTEADGRLYGIISNNAVATGSIAEGLTAGMPTDFHRNAVSSGLTAFAFSGNSSATGYRGSFTVIYPRQTALLTATTDKNYTSFNTSMLSNGYTTLGGRLVRTPMYCKVQERNSTAQNAFLGRLRDISMIKNMPSNVVVRDSSNKILGFSISQSETTSSNAVLLNYS